MANSKYEYVRAFEQPDVLLPNTWIVVRIDGRGFHKFTTKHNFAKPNDRRALDLMNSAAEAVMKELPDLCLAYGTSDEFSFVFHKNCTLFERRASKLTTTIVSTFSSYYTFLWPRYFSDSPLTPPLPSFDGRAVCYPSDQNLRDYMSWRQVDCHINNLYNTTFWTLVLKGGMDARAAEQELSGTVSSDKNEILFSRFGINYNNEPEIFKKGSVLYRDFFPASAKPTSTASASAAQHPELAHPQPRRPDSASLTQPFNDLDFSLRNSSASLDRPTHGPTFLSTSTTPSPPPSPTTMSVPNLPPPPRGNGNKRPHLTPLPIPPPTLARTTRPPASLNPPNLIAHINTSPEPSPSLPLKSPDREVPQGPVRRRPSHSASASLSAPSSRPLTSVSSSGIGDIEGADRNGSPCGSVTRPTLKQRSTSLSLLESQPPIIPVRLSSIPTNNKPRKLSLQSQRSFKAARPEDVESRLREMGLATARSSSTSNRQENNPADIISATHSLTLSQTSTITGPTSSFAAQAPPAETVQPTQAKELTKTKSKAQTQAKSSKSKAKVTEMGSCAADTGRPEEMSRTQREKDRKKRTKARVVIEHVDVIRDEFWERRPWILSGRAGL